jgi:hypothetical protein
VTALVESLQAPWRVSRARRLAIVATAATVGLVGLYAVQYRSARLRLDATRAQLAETQTSLSAAQTELETTQRRGALTQDSIELTRSEIDEAVAARTWIDALTANAAADIASVDADRTEVDTARLLLAAHTNEAMVCFDGVSQAVAANRRGDDQASVGAMQAAADQCTRTLAYATGARFPYDFADPFVVRAEGAYYGYSTNSGAGDIQVIRSTDLVSWELVGNALAGLPSWAAPNATWAPAVLARDGGYVVYYTTREAGSRLQCISRATASTPDGPFVDDSTAPLVCQRDLGGSIDPSPFVDTDGRTYLLWKSEGAGGAAQTIWSQELTADGLALTGPASPLVSADRPFERGVVEGPTLVREAGAYHLMYAAADWSSRHYVTAYATCAGPGGPCTKPADGRVLTSGLRLAGPGGAEVFRDGDGGLWAAFHAFSEPNVGYPSSRYLYVAPVRVTGGRVVIDVAT